MKMNLKVLAPAVIALCFTLTGCSTENYEESHGHVMNSRIYTPPVIVQMQASGGGHLKNGSAFKLFSFYVPHLTPTDRLGGTDNAYLLALLYPTAHPRRTLKTEAGSDQVYASLVPNDLAGYPGLFTYLNLPEDPRLTPTPRMVAVGDWWYRHQVNANLTNEISAAASPADLSIPGSIPLHGAVTIKQKSWFHKNFFHTEINLTGDDGLKLNGEYTTCDYRRFEPVNFAALAILDIYSILGVQVIW